MNNLNGKSVSSKPKRKGQGGPQRVSIVFEQRFEVYKWLRERRKEQVEAGSSPTSLAMEATKELGFEISPNTIVNLIKSGVKQGIFTRPQNRKSDPSGIPQSVKVQDLAVVIESLFDIHRDLGQPLSPSMESLVKKYEPLFQAKQQKSLDDDADKNTERNS